MQGRAYIGIIGDGFGMERRAALRFSFLYTAARADGYASG
jgi:hypothetical protein